jgi:hypothetical protein
VRAESVLDEGSRFVVEIPEELFRRSAAKGG